MWDSEAEFNAKVCSLRVKLAALESQVGILGSSLEKEKKVIKERLAGLEMVASDVVISTHS